MTLPHDMRLAHTKFKQQTQAQRAAIDKVWVKTGTEIIDNVWRQFKTKFIPKELKAETTARVDEYAREAQWKYWHAENDMWETMGVVIADAMR